MTWSTTFLLIGPVFALGLNVLFLLAAIAVFRVRKYWASWLLLLGSSIQILSGVGSAIALYFIYNYSAVSSASFPGPISLSISGILSSLGTLLLAVGVLGVCIRFGVVERRAAQLEALNIQLQERLQD